jgi:IMP dehydrogenase
MPANGARTRKPTPQKPSANGLERAWDVEIEQIPTGLSYDDVLLVPQRTSVASRRLVETSTRLSRNVYLRIPIVSANMDTVTEHTMAIEMARQGGIGIIHRFLTVEDQAAEVRKVKRAESFVIAQP